MPQMPQGTLDLLVLQTLSTGPRHGYAIARWLEVSTDDVLAVQEGALYPSLARLEKQGWVRAKWTTSELNKKVKVYELTARGKKELDRRARNWEALTGAVAKVFDAQ